MLQLKNFLIKTETKNHIFEIYVYLSYIALFLSVGENIKNINLYESYFSLNNLATLRSLAPFIILPINLILFFKIGKHKNTNIIINFFIIFIIIQFISLLGNGFDTFLLQFLIGPLSLISHILIINTKEKIELVRNLIKITFVIITSILIIFIYQNPNLSYGGGQIIFINKPIMFINSNGLSRYLVLLYAVLLTFFIFTKDNYLKFFVVALFVGILVFKYEGRVNIGTFCIISLFIFFKNNKFIKNSLLIIFLFLLSIYISSIWEIMDKKVKLENDTKKSFTFYKENLIETVTSFEFQSSPTNRYAADGKNFSTKKDLAEGVSQSLDNLTTGRSEKWRFLLNYEQNFKNIILGNGPEFDRYLLTRNNIITNKTTGTDSANSLIYVYLTGGLISLLMFIILGINQLYIVLKIIIKKQFLNDKILNLSILCFIILGIRSVFENGLSVWGIDLILFMLFGSIINSRKINKINYD